MSTESGHHPHPSPLPEEEGTGPEGNALSGDSQQRTAAMTLPSPKSITPYPLTKAIAKSLYSFYKNSLGLFAI